LSGSGIAGTNGGGTSDDEEGPLDGSDCGGGGEAQPASRVSAVIDAIRWITGAGRTPER
jgi:hypothetical protein